jgi:hypothetical protein
VDDTSGKMAIILLGSFLEKSWRDVRVAEVGGSSNGEFMDRHRAVRNEVCWTVSVVAKHDTNATSYLKLDFVKLENYFAARYIKSNGLV